jgi:hypothetical protein
MRGLDAGVDLSRPVSNTDGACRQEERAREAVRRDGPTQGCTYVHVSAAGCLGLPPRFRRALRGRQPSPPACALAGQTVGPRDCLARCCWEGRGCSFSEHPVACVPNAGRRNLSICRLLDRRGRPGPRRAVRRGPCAAPFTPCPRSAATYAPPPLVCLAELMSTSAHAGRGTGSVARSGTDPRRGPLGRLLSQRCGRGDCPKPVEYLVVHGSER